MSEWCRQGVLFFRRELRRTLRNSWLLIFTAFSFIGGGLILWLATPGAAGYLFLQAQIFLLPLFAILIGNSGAQEDMEELPVLFSQPVYRGAYLLGKWACFTFVLSGITALAMFPRAWVVEGELTLLILWGQGILLSGVFIALGLLLGTLWRDRAQSLIASFAVWAGFVFGGEAIAWIAVQTGIATAWPTSWVMLLLGNPTSVFRVGALLLMEDIPYHVPASQPLIAWMLEQSALLVPFVCTVWILLALLLGAWRLRRAPVQ